MLVTTSGSMNIVIIFCCSLLYVYKYLTRNNNFWKYKGVDYIKPSFPFGNLKDVIFLKKCVGVWFQELYNSTTSPVLGIYFFDQPGILLKSPEIIKDVLIRDTSVFIDRSVAYPTHDEISRSMMFFQRGLEWKNIRSKMSPVFTSGKLKAMTPLLNHYGIKLITCLSQRTGEVDVREIISDYILDSISKCFFGIETHSLDEKESDFKRNINEVMNPTLKTAWSRLCYIFYPKMVVPLRLQFNEQRHLDYFCDAFQKAIEAREESESRVNDFIDIINDLKKHKEFAKNFNFCK